MMMLLLIVALLFLVLATWWLRAVIRRTTALLDASTRGVARLAKRLEAQAARGPSALEPRLRRLIAEHPRMTALVVTLWVAFMLFVGIGALL